MKKGRTWEEMFGKEYAEKRRAEHITRMSKNNPMKSEDAKKKNKETFKRNYKKENHFNYGKKLSKETKQKIREKRYERKEKLGYINSAEAREKMSETIKKIFYPHKYQPRKEETKKKVSLAKKQYYKEHPEALEKLRNLRKGTKLSAEHKRKISQSHKTPENIERIRKQRANQVMPKKDTIIEVKIQDYLKNLGIEFYTHYYLGIKHFYQCDIFVPSMNLVIEADGDYWHNYPKGREIDHIRTQELKEKGFNVLRLWEREIKQIDIDTFKEKINSEANYA